MDAREDAPLDKPLAAIDEREFLSREVMEESDYSRLSDEQKKVMFDMAELRSGGGSGGARRTGTGSGGGGGGGAAEGMAAAAAVRPSAAAGGGRVIEGLLGTEHKTDAEVRLRLASVNVAHLRQL